MTCKVNAQFSCPASLTHTRATSTPRLSRATRRFESSRGSSRPPTSSRCSSCSSCLALLALDGQPRFSLVVPQHRHAVLAAPPRRLYMSVPLNRKVTHSAPFLNLLFSPTSVFSCKGLYAYDKQLSFLHPHQVTLFGKTKSETVSNAAGVLLEPGGEVAVVTVRRSRTLRALGFSKYTDVRKQWPS